MEAKKPPPARRAYRVAITLHPQREADLYAWTKAVPGGELSAHIKQALREYIARYAGQRVTVPVALRRLQVPAVPDEAEGTVPAAPPSKEPVKAEEAMDPDTLAALRALNARFEG